MKARTFGIEENETIEVVIIAGPTDSGLCKVSDGKHFFARHAARLEPLDEEARQLLKAKVK